jgi:hypothetical protein
VNQNILIECLSEVLLCLSCNVTVQIEDSCSARVVSHPPLIIHSVFSLDHTVILLFIKVSVFAGISFLLHPGNVFGRFCGGSMAHL